MTCPTAAQNAPPPPPVPPVSLASIRMPTDCVQVSLSLDRNLLFSAHQADQLELYLMNKLLSQCVGTIKFSSLSTPSPNPTRNVLPLKRRAPTNIKYSAAKKLAKRPHTFYTTNHKEAKFNPLHNQLEVQNQPQGFLSDLRVNNRVETSPTETEAVSENTELESLLAATIKPEEEEPKDFHQNIATSDPANEMEVAAIENGDTGLSESEDDTATLDNSDNHEDRSSLESLTSEFTAFFPDEEDDGSILDMKIKKDEPICIDLTNKITRQPTEPSSISQPIIPPSLELSSLPATVCSLISSTVSALGASNNLTPNPVKISSNSSPLSSSPAKPTYHSSGNSSTYQNSGGGGGNSSAAANGRRQVKCSLCNYSSNRGANVVRHYQLVHKVPVVAAKSIVKTLKYQPDSPALPPAATAT